MVTPIPGISSNQRAHGTDISHAERASEGHISASAMHLLRKGMPRPD